MTKPDPRLPYTDIDDAFLPPRDPVLGYVKIGGKSPTVRYAKSTGKPWVGPIRLLNPARFEVTTREKILKQIKGERGASKETFTVDLGYVRDEAFHAHDKVGEKPSALRIRLLYPNWNSNLIAFLGAWGSGAWLCKGNGVEATTAKGETCVCPCPRLPQFKGSYEGTNPTDKFVCKPHAQLNVLLEDADVFGGFWAFKTTSYETFSNLKKALQIFQKMFNRLDGIPFELRVQAVTKQIPGGGTTTQPIVAIVVAAGMDTARQVAADAAAESRKYLPAGGALDETKYLEAVVTEMQEEAESYAGEFMPGEDGIEVEPTDEEGEDAEDGSEDAERGSEDGFEDRPSGATGGRGEGPDDEGAPNRPGRAPSKAAAVPAQREDDDPGEGGDDGLSGGPLRDNDSEAVDERSAEEDRIGYEFAESVLKAAKWGSVAIKGRLAYHRQNGTLERLLKGLREHHPEAWAEASTPELDGFDS